ETAATLHDKLLSLGKQSLLTTLNIICSGNLQKEKQNNVEACYAHKINKTEALLDWTLPATVLEQKIRAFNPYPVAYFKLDGFFVRVWESVVLQNISHTAPGQIMQCGDEGIDISTGIHRLRLKKLQLPGKNPWLQKRFLMAIMRF